MFLGIPTSSKPAYDSSMHVAAPFCIDEVSLVGVLVVHDVHPCVVKSNTHTHRRTHAQESKQWALNALEALSFGLHVHWCLVVWHPHASQEPHYHQWRVDLDMDMEVGGQSSLWLGMPSQRGWVEVGGGSSCRGSSTRARWITNK